MLAMVNVDNVAGETIPYVIEKLMGLGAGSVHAIPTITKKGRPGFILLIDTTRDNVKMIGNFLAGEVGTLGLRLFEAIEHIEFDYEMRKVRLTLQDEVTGEETLNLTINVKLIRDNDGLLASAKAEYEELRAATDALVMVNMNVPFVALRGMIESAILNEKGRIYRNLTVEPMGS